jgi:hypothetical protein
LFEKFVLEAVEIRGGDYNLLMLGCGIEQVMTPPRIQFGKDIVQEKNGMFSGSVEHELSLGELKRKGDGPLLAARGVTPCIHLINKEAKIVAVWPYQ